MDIIKMYQNVIANIHTMECTNYVIFYIVNIFYYQINRPIVLIFLFYLFIVMIVYGYVTVIVLNLMVVF
jgi:hypothetical protein